VVETSGATTGEQQQQERDRLLSQTKSGKGGAKWKHWRNTEGIKGGARRISTDSTTPKTLIDMTRLYSKTQNRSIQNPKRHQHRQCERLSPFEGANYEAWYRTCGGGMMRRNDTKE
jgi:hypothetical protein